MGMGSFTVEPQLYRALPHIHGIADGRDDLLKCRKGGDVHDGA